MKSLLSLLLMISILIVSLIFLTKLNVNNTPSSYFVEKAKISKMTKFVRENFVNDDVLFLHFRDELVISKDMLKKISKLIELLEEHVDVREARSVLSTDNMESVEDGFEVLPLIDSEKLDELDLLKVKNELLDNVMAQNIFYSKDLKSFSVIIEFNDLNNSFRRIAFEEFLLKEIKNHGLKKYFKSMAGPMAIDVAEFRLMLEDLKFLIPVTSTVGLILLYFFFPNILVVGFSLFSMLTITSFAVSLFAIFGYPFNLIGTMIPSLLTALTVAFLLHTFSAISKRVQMGEELSTASINGGKDVMIPSFYSALTTAAGLASLATSEIIPTRNFGIFSAIGVMLIFIVSVFLVPNILSHFSTKRWKTNRVSKKILDKIVFFFMKVGIRYSKPILVIVIVFSLGCIPFFYKIVVESNLLKFFKDDHPIVTSTYEIQDKLLGLNTLDLIVLHKNDETVFRKDVLQFIEKLQVYADSFKEIDKTTSVVNFIKDMNYAFNDKLEGTRILPDNFNLVKQYLLIYGGDNIYDFATRDYDKLRIGLSLNIHGANVSSGIIKKLQSYIDENAPKDIRVEPAGVAGVVAYQAKTLVEGQISSLGWGLVIIFILMLVLWRSLTHSLICMIPNVSPILTVFALMGIFNIWLDMGTAMIASVAVGIAIDDTIHVFHSFVEKMKEGSSPIWAIARTFDKSGRAVMSTTFILFVQFILLIFSDFVPTINFGLLTAIGLLTALVYDITFLPALLYLITKSKRLRRIII